MADQVRLDQIRQYLDAAAAQKARNDMEHRQAQSHQPTWSQMIAEKARYALSNPWEHTKQSLANFAQEYLPSEEDRAKQRLAMQGSVFGDWKPAMDKTMQMFGAAPMAGTISPHKFAPSLAPASTKTGFDEWRKAIWDDVKVGKFHPEEKVPSNADIIKGDSPARLFRGMSDVEFDSGMKSGVFRPLRKGDPDLYVTADPDRLAGGAYGAKGGGRIVEFDPVPVKKATGRLIDVDEISSNEIPASKVRRVWKWDESKKDHVLEFERNPLGEEEGALKILDRE